MRGLILAQAGFSFISLVQAYPFSFPLPNGFPFPDNDALEQLYTTAGGNFTNAPLAPKFDDDSLTSWKLQAFNEFMEVAFFTQLISNITEGVPGYELDQTSKCNILKTLKTIQAVRDSRFFEISIMSSQVSSHKPLSLSETLRRNVEKHKD